MINMYPFVGLTIYLLYLFIVNNLYFANIQVFSPRQKVEFFFFAFKKLKFSLCFCIALFFIPYAFAFVSTAFSKYTSTYFKICFYALFGLQKIICIIIFFFLFCLIIKIFFLFSILFFVETIFK